MKAELMIRNVNGNAPKTREDFLKDDTLKIGVGRTLKHGEAMDRFFDELQQRDRVIDVPIGFGYEMLMRERFAAMPIYPRDTNYRNKHDLSQFTIASDWFPTDKSLPRALVQQMRDDGTLKKIFTKNTGKETAKKLMQYPPDAP